MLNRASKQILWIFLIFATTFSSYAYNKNGIYIGAGIGEVYDKFKLTTQNSLTNFTIVSPTENKDGTIGNVFLGFGYIINNGFYLGGELGTYFPHRSAAIYNRPGVALTSTFFNDFLDVTDKVSLDFMPGLQLNHKCLLYGRIGTTYANLKFDQPPAGIAPYFNNNENKFGGRIGVGINYAWTDKVGIGLDYFYTRYPAMNSFAGEFNTEFTQRTSSNYIGASFTYAFFNPHKIHK